MKNSLNLFVFFAVFISGCKKDETPAIITAPTVVNTSYEYISGTTAKAAGLLTSDGGAPLLSYGVYWGTKKSPTDADNTSLSTNIVTGSSFAGGFTCTMTGLTSETVYYLRAFATNSKGTGYANEVSFTTRPMDSDGNSYTTVTLGTQTWFKENLKTSKYSNGDPIPTGVDWGNVTTGAWCYPNNLASNNDPYGKLYNWFALTDPRKLCPSGYHTPSDNEWTVLETFLGGSSIAGGKMKEPGTTHWSAPNTGADNSSTFTGLPAGDRRGDVGAAYESFGTAGRHWTSTQVDASAALVRDLVFDGAQVVNGPTNQFNKKYGFSVRCMKD